MLAGWLGVLGGVLAGAMWRVFDRKGGLYVSLGRRSCLALGAINLLFALTFPFLHLASTEQRVASWGFLGALATMPLLCFLAAWRPFMRLLLPIPIAAAATGILAILIG